MAETIETVIELNKENKSMHIETDYRGTKNFAVLTRQAQR
jgi:hypothetical protein